jgi:hypothetical protein
MTGVHHITQFFSVDMDLVNFFAGLALSGYPPALASQTTRIIDESHWAPSFCPCILILRKTV